MIKNIILLTKIFTLNYIQNINIIDKKTNKINKKSIYFWMLIIISIALFLISSKIIDFLQGIGQEVIFANVYYSFIFILLTIQCILICPSIYYFSKDLEDIIIFPIKPIELVMAKFNTLVSILCVMEILFLFIPMIIYGLSININIILYILLLLIAMLIMPIFIALIVSVINFLLIHFFRIIKNENIYQIIIVTIMTIVLILGEYTFINNIISTNEKFKDTMINLNEMATYINKTTIIVNPLIELIHQKNLLLNFIKILSILFIISIPFIYIGGKTYIKRILSITKYSRIKYKIINLKRKCKEKSVIKSYIANEFKYIIKNTTFFIQYIFPVSILIIVVMIISININSNFIQNNEEIRGYINQIELNVEGFCFLLIIFQIIFSFMHISITAISRYGKNSIFFKYIPIDLYKQFWLKNIIQIGMSSIISLIGCVVIKYIATSIPIKYILMIFINTVLVGILNSIIMLIVDLKRPFINWKTEYEVTKQNSNKLFQYVYTIGMFLILMYLGKIFNTVNFNIAIISITLILVALIIGIDQYVRKQIKENKLYNKIN